MADAVARSADFGRPTPSRAKTARWLIIVGTLLGLLLAGLYGFNRYREHAIANFFAGKGSNSAIINSVSSSSGH